MLKPVPFYYLRHGQTDWNARGIAQGQSDVPLNAQGRAEAREAAALLRNEDVATICTSPLARARETADIIGQALGLTPHVVPGLAEVRFGEREGQPLGPWRDAWLAGKSCPEGAETYAAFMDRALAAINTALNHEAPVLIVAHGGVYWSIDRCLGNALDLKGISHATPLLHLPPENIGTWRRVSLDGNSAEDEV